MIRPGSYPFDRPHGQDPPPGLLPLIGGPPTQVRLRDGTTAWLVTSNAAARAVLGDRRLSADATRPGYPVMSPGRLALTDRPTFLRMDPPAHTILRRMVAPYFSVRRVRQLESQLRATADTLLDELTATGGPADFVAGLAVPLPGRTIETLLGLHTEDQLSGLIAALNTHDIGPAAKEKAATELLDHLDRAVDQQRADPQPGIIGDLVRSQLRPGHVSAAQIAETVRLLLTAGQETTAGMLALSLLDLADDSRWRPHLTGDIPTAEAAVEELLRWHSVVHTGVTRVATDTVTIQGVTIRPGEGVIVSLLAANHDPGRYERPDQLRPGRADADGHLAFGRGIHQCLGQNLARVQIRIGLTAVAHRLPRLHRAAQTLSYTPRAGIFSLQRLLLTW